MTYARSAIGLQIFVAVIIAQLLFGTRFAAAGSPSIESQTVQILSVEAAKGKIRAGVLSIKIKYTKQLEKEYKKEKKAIEEDVSEMIVQDILEEIRRTGNRDKISIIERSRLDEILNEKKLQVTGLTDRNATEIGGIAGLDAILLVNIKVSDSHATASIKILRVRDGEILGIVSGDYY
jgi:hypothetical protein